ncbi:MAG TPA: tRNA epoxyqueuosine(34) reductase QueG [Pseudomonadales bacterium]|nr:tRNA epoxyqueuosine(34) reductase QueG [Pseudomonadales bacterium]
MKPPDLPQDYHQLAARIKAWGVELGFQAVGIAGIELPEDEQHLLDWLQRGDHGDMAYMAQHGSRRGRPAELLPGTLRVISLRLDYLPPGVALQQTLQQPERAYISRYALGRDYHKLMRKRLAQLAERISSAIPAHHYRVFVDSAPVLEKALAVQAGLGWIGKNTLLLNRHAGSWFFLGEIYTNLPLPLDLPTGKGHCGSCRACLDICPTQAFRAPYQLDARRCISYLTIESKGPIPLELRPLIGNRVFGCDDCQLVCPWNRYARPTNERDFLPRHGLEQAQLLELFAWDEASYLARSEGSPLRRIGHAGFLRNLAVALGNLLRQSTAPALRQQIIQQLNARSDHPSALVREHVQWAVAQQQR